MEPQKNRYSPEEVNAILERALAKGSSTTGITHDELLETARELDISEDALHAAITDYEENSLVDSARERWKQRRKKKFFEHLQAYVIVNAALAAMSLVFGGGPWFLWSVFGWGIGLAFDAKEAFYPKEKDIERGANRLLFKERKERQVVDKHFGRNGRSFSYSSSHPMGSHQKKSFVIDGKRGKIIIEKGDKRIEIG